MCKIYALLFMSIVSFWLVSVLLNYYLYFSQYLMPPFHIVIPLKLLILTNQTNLNIYGQTHSNNSSANCQQIVRVYLTVLRGWRLKG